ncbi:unnamed protein product [Citrullus colocynthis]|uniref:Translocon at the inner envelope membrane of chloroplasts 214 n=1 Tax=Citrullus colocynthis TaxID=252529 RepID=A0ABP0YNC7_9ROSI
MIIGFLKQIRDYIHIKFHFHTLPRFPSEPIEDVRTANVNPFVTSTIHRGKPNKQLEAMQRPTNPMGEYNLKWQPTLLRYLEGENKTFGKHELGSLSGIFNINIRFFFWTYFFRKHLENKINLINFQTYSSSNNPFKNLSSQFIIEKHWKYMQIRELA